VYLCMSRCRNMVLFASRFLDVAKFTTQTTFFLYWNFSILYLNDFDLFSCVFLQLLKCSLFRRVRYSASICVQGTFP
jgi:hypothetical protein